MRFFNSASFGNLKNETSGCKDLLLEQPIVAQSREAFAAMVNLKETPATRWGCGQK